MADASCNIIFGAVVDEAYEGIINVTIIATGFSQSFEEQLTGRKPAGRRAQASKSASASEPQAAPEEPRKRSGVFSFLGRSIF